MFVIQITGGRGFRDYKVIYESLKPYVDKYGAANIIVRHGNAQGADTLAGMQGKRLGITVQARKPEYYGYSWDLDRDGFSAGDKRNKAMLAEEPLPDVVLAFPDKQSRGTWNMINDSISAGIEIHVCQVALGLKPDWYTIEKPIEHTIAVANRHHGVKGIYVGRPSILGNPYILTNESDRAKVLEQHNAYLEAEMQNADGAVYKEIHRLADLLYEQDITLVCSCSSKACHADNIARVIMQVYNKDKELTKLWGL